MPRSKCAGQTRKGLAGKKRRARRARARVRITSLSKQVASDG